MKVYQTNEIKNIALLGSSGSGLAPRRGCFGNHLPLRRVRIPAERFRMIGRNFLSYKKQKTPFAACQTRADGIFALWIDADYCGPMY